MKYIFYLLFFIFNTFIFSQESKINSQSIAANNFKSIVKIILIDSIAESIEPGSGYYGRGSGFFVSDDGLVFTNKHVVETALGIINYTYFDKEENDFFVKTALYNTKDLNLNFYEINYISKMSIIVQVYDKQEENTYSLYKAKIISIDTSNFDGAILQIVSKINGQKVTEKFDPVTFGDSDSTHQGEDFCIYGFPAQYKGDYEVVLNDQSTLLEGKHSGFDSGVNRDYGLIKTDAGINSGNSGGPVFNYKGLVIGIASAASSKTGNGFISRINGMYNLAKKDFLLINKLKSYGLMSPSKIVDVSGVINNPQINLPSTDRIKKYNLDQKFERRILGGFWYIKGFASVFQNDNFSIDKSTNTFITTNADSKLHVKNKFSYQFELGKIFSIYRINAENKLSIDWTFINFKFMNRDWSSSNLFTDNINSNFQYNKNQKQSQIGTKLGLLYTRLIKQNNLLDVYYKIGLFSSQTKSPQDEEIGHYSDYTPNEFNRYDVKVFTAGLIHSFGLNFHFLHTIFGLEYNLGQKIGQTTFQSFLGPTDSFGVREEININGHFFVNNLNFTLGFPLYNSKRWKKINQF